MTLLKFIELQRKNTFLNKVPVPIKLFILIFSLLSIFLNIPQIIVMYLLMLILFLLSLLFLIAYRDAGYLLEVYLSYLLLFLLAYFSVIFGQVDLDSLIIRMLYIYTTAFSFIFFVTTTKIKDLERFLVKIRMPKGLIDALVMTWNFIPSTYNELQIVMMSQKARGVELNKGVISKLMNSLIILIPFLYLLLLRIQIIEFSLKARGVE